jgi:hypothetical protein
MEDALKPVKIYVIPGWIYRSIIRNNLNIVDVTSYTKMRQILSLEDFSEWVYVNDILKIDNQAYISTNTLDGLFNNTTLSREQISEYNNSILPLSSTDSIAKSTSHKLLNDNSMDDKSYSFIAGGEINCVILNEGFLSNINNFSNKLQFIKDYLKMCYSSYPIKRVSMISIFNLYVKLV